MRLLVGVLSELLNADDTRWLDFGLSIPASIMTPAAPLDLSVTPNATQDRKTATDAGILSAVVTCGATPFATRYRFRMRILGVQSDYELMASTKEPMAIIDVPSDAAVEIIVQAVNGTRQSAPSAPVVYDPMSRTVSAASAPTMLEHVSAPTPANGNSASGANGDHSPANGARVPART
jgi:hypothetical protein